MTVIASNEIIVCVQISLATNTLFCHLTGRLLSSLDAQLHLAMEDRLFSHNRLYARNIFLKLLCCRLLISIISGCILTLNARGGVIQLKLH